MTLILCTLTHHPPPNLLFAHQILSISFLRKKISVEHKGPDLDALPRDSRACIPQVKRAVGHSKTLALLRVEGVEDDHLRCRLVGDIEPSVILTMVNLEHLVGDSREDLVHSEEILLPIYRLRVQVCHGEVSTWTLQRLPYAIHSRISFEGTNTVNMRPFSLDDLIPPTEHCVFFVSEITIDSRVEFPRRVVFTPHVRLHVHTAHHGCSR